MWGLEQGENELKKLDSNMKIEHFIESLEEHSGSQWLGSEFEVLSTSLSSCTFYKNWRKLIFLVGLEFY